jgi:hypothetical protein
VRLALGGQERFQRRFLDGFHTVLLEDLVDVVQGHESWRSQLDADELSFFINVEDHPRFDPTALLARFVGLAGKMKVRRKKAAVVSVGYSQINLLHLSSRRTP